MLSDTDVTSRAYVWANITVNACWLIWVVFWIVAAFSTKKTIRSQSFIERAFASAFLVAGVVVLVGSPREAYPLREHFLPHATPVAALSALLCVAGLAFTIWARVVLGRNWSARVALKEDHELVERGPYRLVRNPIYTGMLIMVLGSVMLQNRVGALVGWALFFVGLWIKILQEEALLAAQFPGYSEYRRRVKRIIPFVLMLG